MSSSREQAPQPTQQDSAQPDPLVGTVLDGRYRIQKQLAEGGFSVIYRAQQVSLGGRPVAIKVLRKDPQLMVSMIPRFERESETLAAMHHPNIVTVTDYGIFEGMPYLVMELLDGETLRQLLDREKELPPPRAMSIARQMLRGLAYAHACGVMHRDLKPANVFIQRADGEDHVKLLDFGFANFFGPNAPQSDKPKITARGQTFGTPAYMAPELIGGAPTDGRTDVYAAGVLLFEIVTGHKPFDGSLADIVRAHMFNPVPSVGAARPGLYAAQVQMLDAAIGKAMAKTPSDRFQHAGEMIAALDAVTSLGPGLLAPAPPPPSAPTAQAKPTSSERARMASIADVIGEAVPTTLQTPPKRWPLALALAVLAGAIIGGVAIAGALYFSARARDRAEQRRAVHAAERPRAAAAPASTRAPASPSEQSWRDGAAGLRRPARDPWAEAPPDLLARYYGSIQNRQRLRAGDQRRLLAYARRHPHDARPFLLVAYSYMDNEWRSDGLQHYARAYRADPTARGDGRMKRDLIASVSVDAVGDRAAQMVREIYGREALADVQRALGELRSNPATLRRNQATAARLQRLVSALEH